MKKLIAVLSVCMLVPLVAFSNDMIRVAQPQAHTNGKDLITMCSGLYDVDYGYCAGYMKAVADIMMDQPVYGSRACHHAGVRPEQLVENLKMQAGEDPALAQQPASVLASQSLSRSFPCRR